MFCGKCGNKLKGTEKFCTVCGNKIPEKQPANNEVKQNENPVMIDSNIEDNIIENNTQSNEVSEQKLHDNFVYKLQRK